MSITLDTESGEARAIRTVRKSGNSTVVVIPPELLDVAGLKLGDDVDVSVDFDSNEVTIRSVESSPDESPAE